MQIGRWGNSLAVRLPKELVDRYELREGGEIDTAGVEAVLEAQRQQEISRRKEEAFRRMAARRRPLPADYRFDRDEANAR
jgi:antitoxin MazE